MTAAARIIKIVAKQFEDMAPAEAVRLDANLRDDLGADDLDLIEIAMAIEEEFGREIDDRFWPSIVTVSDFLRMVEPEGVPS